MPTLLTQRFTAVLLLVLLTACHSWQQTTVSPQQLIRGEQPTSVRVTRASRETITLRDPTMRNDSVFGVTDADVTGVDLGDIRMLEVRRFSVGRTLGLSVGLTFFALGAVAILVLCTDPDFYC